MATAPRHPCSTATWVRWGPSCWTATPPRKAHGFSLTSSTTTGAAWIPITVPSSTCPGCRWELTEASPPSPRRRTWPRRSMVRCGPAPPDSLPCGTVSPNRVGQAVRKSPQSSTMVRHSASPPLPMSCITITGESTSPGGRGHTLPSCSTPRIPSCGGNLSSSPGNLTGSARRLGRTSTPTSRGLRGPLSGR